MLFALTLLSTSASAADEAPDPAAAQAIAPHPEANFVAVVIGLSSYENLPDPVELDFARSDAAVVHEKLKVEANFTHTFLMTDGEANRERIRELLRTEVAQLVGPNDVFVLYFVGHGVGSDLDAPSLLVFDSTIEAAQKDGFELAALAQDLTTWTQAGTTLIVTDAIHSNQLDGIYFFGPAANQWPPMRTNTMVLSSSQADSPAKDGGFGKIFAEGIGGSADRNRDGLVTAGELQGFLEERIAPIGQFPVSAGSYSDGMVLAKGVTNKEDPGKPQMTEQEKLDAANAMFPDTEVFSAKFVFREGASQTVTCRDQETRSCTPSCYERDFPAGICELTALVDGTTLRGKVPVILPGKYDCGLKAGLLTCKPPLQPAEKN